MNNAVKDLVSSNLLANETLKQHVMMNNRTGMLLNFLKDQNMFLEYYFENLPIPFKLLTISLQARNSNPFLKVIFQIKLDVNSTRHNSFNHLDSFLYSEGLTVARSDSLLWKMLLTLSSDLGNSFNLQSTFEYLKIWNNYYLRQRCKTYILRSAI